MILIAHRGNIHGPDHKLENRPVYIQQALSRGYDIEIDVWYKQGEWLLGHDESQYKTSLRFLQTPGLWCHAKNFAALYEMLKQNIHCFWHEDDAAVLTSKGYIWTYPGNELTPKSICVMPEWRENKDIRITGCAGVCSDYIADYA